MKRNRREFIHNALRVITLGALAGGAAALIARPRRIEKCIADGICARCSEVSDCGLPQAASYKTYVRQIK